MKNKLVILVLLVLGVLSARGGIFTGSGTNIQIYNNSFDGTYDFLPPDDERIPSANYANSQYSVYVAGNGTNSTLAKFEDNSFYGGTVGSVFYNTGPTALIAKNNSYDSIAGLPNACAAIAIGKNSNYNGSQFGDVGLQLRCNEFTRNPYAISIVDGNLRKYQGEQNAGSGSAYAGNEFDHYSSNTERDLYVDQVIASSLDIPYYEYYSHSDSIHRIKYYTKVVDGLDSLVYNKGRVYYFDDVDCSGGAGGGIGMGMLAGGFEQVQTLDNEITLEEFDLAEAIDNGNSMQLLALAETMNENNSAAVAEAIGGASGLISDEVALAYMGNDAGNPFAKAGALLENSPLPIAVQGEIDNMEMNPALLQIIKQNQAGMNSRDSIEAVIAAKKQMRSQSLKSIVNYAMENDTITELRTSVIEFLESDYQLESKWHLYDLYRLKGEYANARNTLGVIYELTAGMDIDYTSEMHDYINLEQVLLNIAEGILSVEDAVESNKVLIEKIAHTESHFGQVTAQLLLAEAGVESYYEVIRLPEAEMDTKSAKISESVSNSISVCTDIVNIYPNPTDGQINIEYALFKTPTNKFIEIYTVSGSIVERLELRQNVGFVCYSKALPSGMYLVKVGDNFSQKIEVK